MKHLLNLLIISALFGVLFTSCVKEDAIPPNAEFTTKLVDNTAYAGETFYIYLNKTKGDFFTLYNGLNEARTYSADDPTRTGVSIPTSTDSFAITYYNNPGQFPLTMVAASSGNWGDDYEMMVYTLDLNVVDIRTGFTSFEINKVQGVFLPGENTILFYATKNANLSATKPRFLTASTKAKVFIGDVLQTGGVSVVDFTPSDPNSNESKTIKYTVLAGDSITTADYNVKFILSDPSTETDLVSLSSTTLGTTITPDENDDIQVNYYTGTNLASVKFLATVSPGAIAKIGATTISAKETASNLVLNTTVDVTAEDGVTVKSYDIILQEVEKITGFKFISNAAGALNPVPTATIVAATKTISLNVPASLDLTTLVAEFTGITNQTVKIGDATLVSGTTAFDYSGLNYTIDIYNGEDKLNSYTLVITQL